MTIYKDTMIKRACMKEISPLLVKFNHLNRENIDIDEKKDFLKELKEIKSTLIQYQKDILQNQTRMKLYGVDEEYICEISTFCFEIYVLIYSIVASDYVFYKSIITASKLIDELVETLFHDKSNPFFNSKEFIKVNFVKAVITDIYAEINRNELMKCLDNPDEEKAKELYSQYIRNISQKSILNIFNNNNKSIQISEFIKYVKRIERYGEYKDLKAKEKAIFKIFNPPIDPSTPHEIAEYKYRDTITSDYSDRMNCILKVLRKTGNKGNPTFEQKDNYTVYKMGEALDDSDIELFYYLIGELEEHGCDNKITFRKSDFVNNMNYKSVRGQKLDNLTSSLMNLNTQSIAIVDERKDKTGKKLKDIEVGKKGTQLIRIDFKGKGDEMLIHIESPFSKYFRQQKQFGRILNKNMISKYLFTNPRILKIAREITRMLYINSQKNKKINELQINYDTLIRNIDEWDKYKSYSNKRVFLNRLNNDIEKALKNIKNSKNNYNFELIKPTPTTIKNGKIKMLKCN